MCGIEQQVLEVSDGDGPVLQYPGHVVEVGALENVVGQVQGILTAQVARDAEPVVDEAPGIGILQACQVKDDVVVDRVAAQQAVLRLGLLDASVVLEVVVLPERGESEQPRYEFTKQPGELLTVDVKAGSTLRALTVLVAEHGQQSNDARAPVCHVVKTGVGPVDKCEVNRDIPGPYHACITPHGNVGGRHATERLAMDHDLHVRLLLLVGTKDLRFLQHKLLNGIFQNDLGILHHIVGIQDSKVLLPELRRAAHVRAAVPAVVEDDHVHAQNARIEIHPLRLVVKIFVEDGVWIAEEYEVCGLIIDLQLFKWIALGSSR